MKCCEAIIGGLLVDPNFNFIVSNALFSILQNGRGHVIKAFKCCQVQCCVPSVINQVNYGYSQAIVDEPFKSESISLLNERKDLISHLFHFLQFDSGLSDLIESLVFFGASFLEGTFIEFYSV